MSRGGDHFMKVPQYIESLLVFEVVQQAAPCAFCNKQRLTLIKHWIQINTVRANLGPNHRAKKGIATSFTSRRQARLDILLTLGAEEIVRSTFNRIAAMHTTSREDEIEGSFDQTIHQLMFTETFGFNKAKHLVMCGDARLLIKHVIEAQPGPRRGDDTVGTLLAGENFADIFGA